MGAQDRWERAGSPDSAADVQHRAPDPEQWSDPGMCDCVSEVLCAADFLALTSP